MPVAAESHKAAGGDLAVLGLPGLQIVDGQHKVGIRGTLFGLIHHHQRHYHLGDINGFHRTAFAPEVTGNIHMGAVLAGHADLEAAHGSHHILRGAFHIVKQQFCFQRIKTVPMGGLGAQLMGQVDPLVLFGLQFTYQIPQCKVCHNYILLKIVFVGSFSCFGKICGFCINPSKTPGT